MPETGWALRHFQHEAVVAASRRVTDAIRLAGIEEQRAAAGHENFPTACMMLHEDPAQREYQDVRRGVFLGAAGPGLGTARNPLDLQLRAAVERLKGERHAWLRDYSFEALAVASMRGSNTMTGVFTTTPGAAAGGARSPFGPSSRMKRYIARKSSSLMSRRLNHGIGGPRGARADGTH